MHSLFARAGRAAAWAAAAKWFDMLGSLVTFLLMVRLLGPQSFGLYGMALLAILLPETVVAGALSEGLIQRRELRPGHVAGAFLLQLVLSLVLLGALLVASPWLAGRFGHVELRLLIPLMAFTLLPLALGAVPTALLQRELRFKAIAAVDAAGALSAAVVGIGLALAGFGVWALAWMEVARRVVRAAGFIAASGWRPSFRASASDVTELASYNLMTLGTRLLTQADQAVPRLVVSMVLGAQALGYFNMAWRIYQQATAVIIAPFNAVALPVAASAQNDRAQLHAALGGATGFAALIAYPAFIGAAAVAPSAIPLLLGASWAPAVPTVQLMMLMGVRAATASFNGGVLRGGGRPGLQMATVACGLGLSTVLSPLAAQWGLTAIAAVVLVRGLATWALGAWFVEKSAGYPARLQILVGWQSLAAAAVMAAAVISARPVLAGVLSDWRLLLALVAIGAVTHVAVLAALSPALARRGAQIGLALMRRDRSRVSALVRDAWAARQA